MPIYEYVCPAGHRSEELRKYEERDTPLECFECERPDVMMRRHFSAHHKQPDGMYSYAPNIGDPAKFDRNVAGIAKLKERMAEKKDRRHPP